MSCVLPGPCRASVCSACGSAATDRSSLGLASAQRPRPNAMPLPTQRTADDEFSRQLSELKKTFTDLSKRIDDSAQTMGRSQNAEAARKEIEELRAHVGALLGAVADNGTVWNLGAKALRPGRGQAQGARAGNPLQAGGEAVPDPALARAEGATEGAIGELEKARKDFAELLRTLQTNEDFIDELLQVREHEKALEVIQRLTDGIRDASTSSRSS